MEPRVIILGQRERVAAWVAARIGRHCAWSGYEAIGIERAGRLIGGVVIESYVPGARCVVHAAGEGRAWVTRRLVWMFSDYVFNQLGCRVALATIDADNADSIRFTRHFGFEELVRVPHGAGDCDLLVFSLPRENCRWLGITERKTCVH